MAHKKDNEIPSAEEISKMLDNLVEIGFIEKKKIDGEDCFKLKYVPKNDQELSEMFEAFIQQEHYEKFFEKLETDKDFARSWEKYLKLSMRQNQEGFFDLVNNITNFNKKYRDWYEDRSQGIVLSDRKDLELAILVGNDYYLSHLDEQAIEELIQSSDNAVRKRIEDIKRDPSLVFHEVDKNNPELQNLIELANELFPQQPNAFLLGFFTLSGVFLGKHYTIIVAGVDGKHLIEGILSCFPKNSVYTLPWSQRTIDFDEFKDRKIIYFENYKKNRDLIRQISDTRDNAVVIESKGGSIEFNKVSIIAHANPEDVYDYQPLPLDALLIFIS